MYMIYRNVAPSDKLLIPLLQDLTTEADAEILSNKVYMKEFEAPVQTEFQLDLSSLAGKPSSLYWSPSGSSIIELSIPQSSVSCPVVSND